MVLFSYLRVRGMAETAFKRHSSGKELPWWQRDPPQGPCVRVPVCLCTPSQMLHLSGPLKKQAEVKVFGDAVLKPTEG